MYNVGYWGNWGKAALCPAGEFVYGYSLKSEPDQHGGDDTALNGIRLFCGPYTNATSKRTMKTSLEGPWGDWLDPEDCGRYPVIGFDMKIEGDQHGGDDTAANELRLFCMKGKRYIHAKTWGEWTDPLICPKEMAVIGFKTRVEGNQRGRDDTALNGVGLTLLKSSR